MLKGLLCSSILLVPIFHIFTFMRFLCSSHILLKYWSSFSILNLFLRKMMCLFAVKFAADASRLKVVPFLLIQYWLSVLYWLQIARMLTVKREREIEEGVGKRLSRKLDRQWKRSIVVRPPPSLKKLQEEEAAAEAEKSAWANCFVLFLNEFDVISRHRRSSILLHWLRNFSSWSLYSSLCLILGLFFFSKVPISLIACLNVTIEQHETKIPHNIVLFLNAAVSYSFIFFSYLPLSVIPLSTSKHHEQMEEESPPPSDLSSPNPTSPMDHALQKKHQAMLDRLSNRHQSRQKTASTASFLSTFTDSKSSIESQLTQHNRSCSLKISYRQHLLPRKTRRWKLLLSPLWNPLLS